MAAQIMKEFGVRPWEIAQMTLTELLLYTVDTEKSEPPDRFVAKQQIAAFRTLTIEERIEMARRVYG